MNHAIVIPAAARTITEGVIERVVEISAEPDHSMMAGRPAAASNASSADSTAMSTRGQRSPEPRSLHGPYAAGSSSLCG